jgi:hypothetical protein
MPGCGSRSIVALNPASGPGNQPPPPPPYQQQQQPYYPPGQQPYIPPGAPGYYQQPPVQEDVSGLKVGMIILTIFIPLAGIIAGIVFLNSNSPAKRGVGKACFITLGIYLAVVVLVLAAAASRY